MNIIYVSICLSVCLSIYVSCLFLILSLEPSYIHGYKDLKGHAVAAVSGVAQVWQIDVATDPAWAKWGGLWQLQDTLRTTNGF